MTTRTVAVALWRYRDGTGKRRRAHHGQTVDLDDVQPSDRERAERLEVFEPESQAGATGGQPKQAAVKAEWVDYAESLGIDRAQADAMTKPDLITAVQAHLVAAEV